MNELLPFGEYASRQQIEEESSALSTWEMERFLVQLAAIERRQQRRARRQQRTASAQGGEGRSATASIPITPSSAPSANANEDSNACCASSWPQGGASGSQGHQEGLSPIMRSASQSFKSMKSKFSALRLRYVVSVDFGCTVLVAVGYLDDDDLFICYSAPVKASSMVVTIIESVSNEIDVML